MLFLNLYPISHNDENTLITATFLGYVQHIKELQVIFQIEV